MNLTPPKPLKKPETKYLKVYLEDAEANRFIKALITRRVQNKVKEACGALLKPIPISVGCENLQGLQQFDPHFKTVLIAVDADSTVRKGKGRNKIKNVVKLPGGSDAAGRGFNPERTIYEFVKELIENEDNYVRTREHLDALGVTSDQLYHHLIEGDVVITKRESSKNWMKARLQIIDDWNLIGLWLAEHPEKVQAFEGELLKAAVATAELTF
jgi:hypothetical protein